MTTQFNSGDKVKCVDSNDCSYIKEGFSYTVEAVSNSGRVMIQEVNAKYHVAHYYGPERFELVAEAPAVIKDHSYTVEYKEGETTLLLRGKFTPEQITAILAVIQ